MTARLNRRDALLGLAALPMLNGSALAATTKPIRLTLLGQALLEHDLRTQVWPDRDKVAALVGRGDVAFTNLETVIKGDSVGAPTRELLTLHAGGPEVIDCLKSLNINLVATANNHAFDLGPEGILSTLAALDAAGLPHAGTGKDLASASAAAFQTTRSGARVAVIGFATGKVRDGGAASPTRPGVNEVREVSDGVLNTEDTARVFASIRAAAASADLVIAYHHNHLWGADSAVTYPWQQALAKACIDAGATVYMAHGAPMMHGLEFYKDAPMFYGLGNFIFQTETKPGTYSQRSWDGLVVDCRFGGGKRPIIELTPLSQNETVLGGVEDFETRGRPSLATAAAATRILSDFASRSKAFGATVSIVNGVGRVA